MLRGNFSAKIDDKGRLKLPTAFRLLIEEKYGSSLFVTSISGESVNIYPMPVWIGLEERLARVPSTHPARTKFSDRVNFFGQSAEFDKQGRVSVHTRLRDAASIVGDVDVFGVYDHLEVWNHKHFLARLERESFTDDDARVLSEFGI